MSSTPTIKTMRLAGGDASLDFVNTLDARYAGPDLLQTYLDLLIWAERVGLLERGEAAKLRAAAERAPVAAEAALKRAKATREALYEVLLSEVTDRPPDADNVHHVSRVIARAMNSRQLCWDGGITWVWKEAGDLDSVLCRVALAASSLLSNRTRRPLRRCGGLNCGWLFLDTSRGGRRRWCSDESCGAKARVRRFRGQ
jgi:predicted RNA-binding Zn ribbon-like protein